MAKISRGSRVREKLLAFFGRFAWVPAIPFIAFGPFTWTLSGQNDFQLVFVYLASNLALVSIPILLLTTLGIVYLLGTKRWDAEEVEINEEGLFIGGARIARSALATAWMIGRDELEVLTHDGDQVHLTFQDPQDATAFAAAIRKASDRSRSWVLRNGSHIMRLFRKSMGTFVPLTFAGVLTAASPWLSPSLPIAAAIAWVIARGERRARFGADGLHIEGRFRSRFIPYRDIERAVSSAGSPSVSACASSCMTARTMWSCAG